MQFLYQLNRFAIFVMMVLYAPFVLAAAGVCFAIAYWITAPVCRTLFTGVPSLFGIAVGLFVAVIDLILLAVAWRLVVGLIPLLFRDQDRLPEGLPLTAEVHPNLFQLIRRMAAMLGTQPPDEVVLTPCEEAWIGEDRVAVGPGTRRKRFRRLGIGAGIIVHLRISEFGTVLCHELAHAATGDTRLSLATARFFNSLEHAVQLQHGGEYRFDDRSRSPTRLVLYGVLLAYSRLFDLLYSINCRWREHEADRRAAVICGPQNVRNMLMKIHLAGQLPELSLGRLFAEYAENERDIRNIYQEYRMRWKRLLPSRVREAENAMFLQNGSVLASHPRLAARMAYVSQVKAKEWTVDGPATKLFSRWKELEEKITKDLVTSGRKAFAEYLEYLDGRLLPREDDEIRWSDTV